MKFTRYLQDTQTSEWKKAYIDYHRLKIQLAIIQSKILRPTDTWSSFGDVNIDQVLRVSPDSEENNDDAEHMYFNPGPITSPHISGVWASGIDPTMNGLTDSSGHEPAFFMKRSTTHQEISSFGLNRASPPIRVIEKSLNVPQACLLPKVHRNTLDFPLFRGSETPTPPTLRTLLSNLPPVHAEFFDMLDAELDKVETFYTERAKEMQERAKTLRKQLDELGIHRQVFYESSARSRASSWAKRAFLSIPPALSSMIRCLWGTGRSRRALERRRLNVDHCRRRGLASDAAGINRSTPSSITLNSSAGLPNGHWSSFPGRKHSLDPREYRRAKRQLRHAVVEHHRGLEILNNYRMVNLTGFRKALKKYGKVTRISVIDAYMKDKLKPSAFGSGAMVNAMLKEVEDLFAVRFEHGDRKKAMNSLRVESSSKTYHSSMYRSGVWLGLAVPAIGAGCYLSFQKYTRETLPYWNVLLFIYSIYFLPILLALLVGINVLSWANQKISYVFIFKLNLRSRLDQHEYFELPSFLLCTLAYAFWFSMAQFGSPMLWPLIWFGLTFAVMLNPHRNFMSGGARRWTINKLAKLAVCWMWEVEFTDIWLGDQLCSVVYSISNLYFVACFYTHFPFNSPTNRPAISAYASDVWSTCSITQNWGWYYVLSILPFVVRFVHNLRRYWDSKLPSQLLNAGKYGMGIIYYFSYCYWRHQLNSRTGKGFILFCFTAVANALYSCVWDIAIDWGLCEPHALYPLLRSDLIYKSHIPYYYITMVSNICIRFAWVVLVLVNEKHYELYAFIIALLEILRRVQWNFFRLENKHLQNTGLHRIVREAPLPYNLDVYSTEEARLRKRMAHLS